ncbi:zinc finger protein 501 [Drosophila tropicalis]|uniref:zinc finger protein 501 n=1 Tax=Drosophila tropicalis TaxID=46794 RepID=UPI0035ABC7B2
MLTLANLAQLCRICLRQLREAGAVCNDQSRELKSISNPQFVALLKQCLAIDDDALDVDDCKNFPHAICALCYKAIDYFVELCQAAKASAVTLRQLKKQQDKHIGKELVENVQISGELEVKEEQMEEVQQPQDDFVANTQEDKEDAKTESDADEMEMALDEAMQQQQQPSELSMQMSNNKRRSLACNQCGKQVYKLPYLEAHIRSVHEGHSKPFLCVLCKKSFTRYEQLRSHMRNVHPNSSSKQQDHQSLDEEQDQVQRLICLHCKRKYSTKNALGEHLKRHAQHKEHICEHCGVAKVTRTELLTHLRIHNPSWEKFKCQQCPQLFRHKSAISRHVRVVHEGQRRFQCAHCEKRFGTHASQLRHERLHTGQLPHRCEICTKCFPDGDRLTAHIRTHDRNLWPFSCMHCDKPCVTLQNLERHQRRHSSKNQPHICANCNRSFSTDEMLANHKQEACSTQEQKLIAINEKTA